MGTRTVDFTITVRENGNIRLDCKDNGSGCTRSWIIEDIKYGDDLSKEIGDEVLSWCEIEKENTYEEN